MSQLSLIGGVRINKGRFEAYLSKDNTRFYFDAGPELDTIQEYFMFLRTEDPSKQIGSVLVNRGISAKGLPTVSFNFLGTKYILYRKDINYSVLVLQLPLSGQNSESEAYSSAGGYNEDGDDDEYNG